MKKINILKKIIISIFLLVLLWFLGDMVLVLFAFLFEKDVLNLGHFNNENIHIAFKFLAIAKAIMLAIFIYASYLLIKILLLKNTTDYLNKKTSYLLKKSGKLIIISNGINFILSFGVFFANIKYYVYFNSDSRILSLLMLVFGLFLIIFSNVIEKTKYLKQENDLTI